jgi:CheY-like chemotaxis protein
MPVLVLAREPVVAALLGLLVESERYEPVFATAAESPSDAVGRVRMPAVVLVDGTLEMADSDLFFARVMRSRARTILFAPPVVTTQDADVAERVHAIARQRAVPYLALPVAYDDLQRCLEDPAR